MRTLVILGGGGGGKLVLAAVSLLALLQPSGSFCQPASAGSRLASASLQPRSVAFLAPAALAPTGTRLSSEASERRREVERTGWRRIRRPRLAPSLSSWRTRQSLIPCQVGDVHSDRENISLSSGQASNESEAANEIKNQWSSVEAVEEGGAASSSDVSSYWMDYYMRVVCDEASGPRQTPAQELEELEAKLEQGKMSAERFNEMKGVIFKRFWKELVTQDTMKRRFREKQIAVQVTNSAQFADSWIRINVLEKNENLIGLAVEWNSGVRVKGGNRHRISVIQISTRTAVLVVQLAQIFPSRVPPLLEQVLSDPNIRKVGAGILMDSLKLRKDWGIQVRGRVDVYHWGRDLGYCDKGKGISAVARSVLALDYEMPATVRKGNWEAETLSNLQLTCSALDAWIAREALCYLETLTRRPAPRDDSLPSEALARGRLGNKAEAVLPLPDAYRQQIPQQVDKGEPDMVLYIPKTDVRKPGAEAHWVWRGTRVSNRHIQSYCQVELEIEDYEAGGSGRTCSRIHLWGGEANVWEATQMIKKLLARSQLDEQYLACGLAVPAFIERTDSETVQSTALVNTPEVVAWSFFPKTLTQTFTGGRLEIRGRRERKDRERAVFFAQADAAEKAADALLGRQRPGVIIGPLPAGFDPCVMWDVTKYEL